MLALQLTPWYVSITVNKAAKSTYTVQIECLMLPRVLVAGVVVGGVWGIGIPGNRKCARLYAVLAVRSGAVYPQGMSLEKILICFWNAHTVLPISAFRNGCALLLLLQEKVGGSRFLTVGGVASALPRSRAWPRALRAFAHGASLNGPYLLPRDSSARLRDPVLQEAAQGISEGRHATQANPNCRLGNLTVTGQGASDQTLPPPIS